MYTNNFLRLHGHRRHLTGNNYSPCLLPVFQRQGKRKEISRLMEECGIEFVFSCASPENFYFLNKHLNILLKGDRGLPNESTTQIDIQLL